MYAYVSLALEGAKGVVAVPVQALDRGEDKTTVLVVDRGTIVRRTVAVGLETPDRVEVISGIADGELVVLGNRSQLREGAAVTTKLDAADARTR